MKNQQCPDCGAEMEEGFPLDKTDGKPVQATWHRGTVEPQKHFGLFTMGIKLDRQKMRKVTSFRCTQCGLLKSYAREQT